MKNKNLLQVIVFISSAIIPVNASADLIKITYLAELTYASDKGVYAKAEGNISGSIIIDSKAKDADPDSNNGMFSYSSSLPSFTVMVPNSKDINGKLTGMTVSKNSIKKGFDSIAFFTMDQGYFLQIIFTDKSNTLPNDSIPAIGTINKFIRNGSFKLMELKKGNVLLKAKIIFAKASKGGNPGGREPSIKEIIKDGKKNEFVRLLTKEGLEADGATGRKHHRYYVFSYFGAGRFSELDKLIEKWTNPDERLFDGTWKLDNVFYTFLDYFGRGVGWNESYKQIRKWKKSNPKSKGAAFVEALYWISYAWNVRGSGYGSSVDREAWKQYSVRLDKAEKVLLSSKEYASTNPLWYSIYLHIATSKNWEKKRLMSLFNEAVSKNKYFYLNYHMMVRGLSPKWGGSLELTEAFIQQAVKHAGEKEGSALYTQLYSDVANINHLSGSLFSNTYAEWPKMKEGYLDLLKQYPRSRWNLNKFAAYACQAGDKEKFIELRGKIGKYIYRSAWPSNYSLDLCENKFLEKT